MKLKPIHYFLGGVALTALVAAARFAGGTPLDQTFTYQGQLRNAGQLVSGPVDLRITLWDSDTAGSQVGSANSFNAMQLTDGRFACGLNFGNAAFDGSNRWIQVEFRNPAGSGQYLALSPRDKITATPYALYALNGANGVWVYDTNQQSVSVMGKKVGIGTSNPTAALEVVDATGGDDSVKLPGESVGYSEMDRETRSRAMMLATPGGQVSKSFSLSRPCCLFVHSVAEADGMNGFLRVRVDGELAQTFRTVDPDNYPWASHLYMVSFVKSVSAGTHEISLEAARQASVSVLVFDELMP
jgi:hypothetical protein